MTGSHAYDPEQRVVDEADAWLNVLREGDTSESAVNLEAKLSRWDLFALRHRGLALTAPTDKGALNVSALGRETWGVLRLALPLRWRRVHLPGGITCDGHGNVVSRAGGAP